MIFLNFIQNYCCNSRFYARLIFSVTLLLLGIRSYGQLNENVRKYNQFVNTAEIRISTGRLSEAVDQYNNAFSIAQPWIKDVYNCTLANLDIGDLQAALKNCDLLASIGAGPRFFERAEFNKLRKTSAFKSITANAEKTFDSLHSANADFFRELDTLFTIDQRVAKDCSAPEHHETVAAATAVIDRFDSVANLFLQMINKFGFPSAKTLGSYRSDSVVQLGASYDIIILHAYQRASWGTLQKIHKYTLDRYYSGFVSIPQLRMWLESSIFAGVAIGERYRIAVDTCNIYHQKIPPDITAAINKTRQALELQSLDNLDKIIAYKVKNPNSHYILSYEFVDYRKDPMSATQAGRLDSYEISQKINNSCK
jgi:hypothetical protein